MAAPIRIGILGDYNPEFASHPATGAALDHAAARLGLAVEWTWMSTPSLLAPGAEAALAACHGLWAAAGSPYRSFDGMLRGIRFARTRDWPFVGT